MFYKDIGKDEPVVMLHGFMENHKMWNDFAEELSKNYRVIYPDLLGHGQTKTVADKHTMELQAQQVLRLLEDLNIESANFIGHSMGGYISLAIARDFPKKVKRLCLFFSSSLADSEEKKEQRLKAIETVKEHRESFIKHGVRGLFNSNKIQALEQEVKTARQWAAETPTDGIIAALLGMRERKDTTQVLQNVTYPVQIILGEYDDVVDAAAYQKQIPQKPNIQVNVLSVGHMGHLEAPQESLGIIQELLKR